MGRLARLALIFILATIANWPTAGRGDAIPPAVVESYGHLTVLRLRGTSYEMGYQHGIAQRAAIRQWVDDEVYRRVIIEGEQSHGVLLAQIHQLERALPAEIRRELHGIADGAGLSYDDVLLLNLALNRLTPLALISTNALPPLPVLDLQALAFAAWPPATSQQSAPDDTLLGYSLNAPGEAGRLRQHLLAVIYQPTSGQAYATLTWSGQIGAWCGLNEASLAVCATPAGPAKDGDAGRRELFPPILVRQLLAHAQDSEQAMRQAVQYDYLAAFQLLVADGRRQNATAIAFDSHRHETIASQTGLLTFGPDQAQLLSLLNRNPGGLDMDEALLALSSRQAPDEGLPGVCSESTLLNALFVPRRGELWVGMDLWPASCRRYLRLRLTG